MRLLFFVFTLFLVTMPIQVTADKGVFSFRGAIPIDDGELRRLIGRELRYAGEITFDDEAIPYDTSNSDPEIFESDHYPYEDLEMNLAGTKIHFDREKMDTRPENEFMIIVGDRKIAPEWDYVQFIVSLNEGIRIRNKDFRVWVQPYGRGPHSSFFGTDAKKTKLITSQVLNVKRVIIGLERISDGSVYQLVDTNPSFSLSTDGHVTDFVWPVDPTESSGGHYEVCGDPGTTFCYWLSDFSEDEFSVWRDVQPFQQDYNSDFGGYHLGADYNLGSGTYDAGMNVHPVADGVVSRVIPNACGYGNVIFVKHETDSGPVTSMYAHVDWHPEFGMPIKDQTVNPAYPIAVVGNGSFVCSSGSTGNYPYHLHLEIREGDSSRLKGAYTKKRVQIGPQGQIDPNKFIRDH